MTNYLCKSLKYFAVVYLYADIYIQFAEDLVGYLYQLQFVYLGLAAYHIHIALVEFAVASLLRAVRSPYRLNLEAFEREGNLVLVLDNISCKWNGKVVAQSLLANLKGEGIAVRELFSINSGKGLAGVEYLEEQLVSLVAILAKQGG